MINNVSVLLEIILYGVIRYSIIGQRLQSAIPHFCYLYTWLLYSQLKYLYIYNFMYKHY